MGAASRTLGLDTPVQYLKGVGPVRAQQLARLGIDVAADLVHHYPVDYLDRGSMLPLERLRPGARAISRGKVLDVQRRRRRSGPPLVLAVLGDGRARLRLSWFNAPYVADRLRVGEEIVVAGELSRFAGRLQMVNPQFESAEAAGELSSGRPVPRYPLTAGLKPSALRRIIAQSLDALLEFVEDPLPSRWRTQLDLLPRRQALAWLHRPKDLQDAKRARRRLAFDEAFGLQLAVGIRRARLLRRPSRIQLGQYGELSSRYVDGLGFTPTSAQRRVLKAIATDLRSPTAMHRLLQGDVGSGKTLVAIIAMIWIVEAGGQAAFMAPTEVLARQHGLRHGDAFAALGLRSVVLTGSSSAAERRTILEGLRNGDVHVVFGTHALIQDDVAFARLGLAVVDEQHRFGVLQRVSLAGDGAHVLVMSATPIPRSLALTVYGDLDLSILDELPPGRSPVKTEIVDDGDLDEVYEDLRHRVQRGERAYLVYPLVEDSESSDLASAEAAFQELARGPLEGLRLGLLHGRMSAREKDRVSQDFARGDLDALVATTVVEVGIDVPEASLMVVRHAERFGLAQLHQLRGRVGRGRAGSRCVLVPGEGCAHAGLRRLHHVASTSDGFRLAELDLRERGMGDLHGVRQHGALPFRLLQPLEDEDLVRRAREIAGQILDVDPALARPEHRSLRTWLNELGRRSPLWSAAG